MLKNIQIEKGLQLKFVIQNLTLENNFLLEHKFETKLEYRFI